MNLFQAWEYAAYHNTVQKVYYLWYALFITFYSPTLRGITATDAGETVSGICVWFCGPEITVAGAGMVAFRKQSCRSSFPRETKLQFWTVCEFPSCQTTFYLTFQNTDSMAKSKLYLPTLIFNINTFVFYINKLQEGKNACWHTALHKKCICNLTCNTAKQCLSSCSLKYTRTLFIWQIASFFIQTISQDVRQWNDCCYPDLPRQGPHILVQCTAVNIRFLLVKFKEGATNGFIRLVEVSRVTNTYTECHSSTSETGKTTSWMIFSRWQSVHGLLL